MLRRFPENSIIFIDIILRMLSERLVGAALIYTSANNNINCHRLSRYLLHLLYPEALPLTHLSIEVLFPS